MKNTKETWKTDTRKRVQEVEYDYCTPLVFLTRGGMGKAVTVMVKRLASLLSTRQNPLVMGCLLKFFFIHGSRSSSGQPGFPAPTDLVFAESMVSTVCILPP